MCSLYDSDVSQDWYSPSYSPPDHAYTPTGDVDVVVDDYPTDDDYAYDYSDDYDWTYDERPLGTGRKLPAPPPTCVAVDAEQPPPAADSAPPPPLMNGYTDEPRDYADYNGYYDAVDDYYDVSDGYDRTSEAYDDRYYMNYDGDYGDSLVNGYTDDYVHGGDMDRLKQNYYDYNDKSYDVGYAPSSQYDVTERSTDVDEQSVPYRLPPLPSSAPLAVQVDDAGRQDAIYDDGYVDRDGVYHHYDDRYDDARRYSKYAEPSVPSDAGESAYDVDEFNEDVVSSVPARSSIDSSARYDRFYDGKTDSFDSYDRDVTTYDATTSRKDSGYQTFQQQQQQQLGPSDPQLLPVFNHVYVDAWQPPPVNVDARPSPISDIDAQDNRQSFVVGRPADSTFAPWPAVSPSVPPYSDSLPSARATAAGFCDSVLATSSFDSTSIGSVSTDGSLLLSVPAYERGRRARNGLRSQRVRIYEGDILRFLWDFAACPLKRINITVLREAITIRWPGHGAPQRGAYC